MRQIFSSLLIAASLLLAPSTTHAAQDPNHKALLSLLESARKAPSDPATCAATRDAAVSAASTLATDSCASGYKVGSVPGALIAYRLLLRIGAVLLHRHGCAEVAKTVLAAAKTLLQGAVASCITGPEADAATDGIDAAIASAAALTDGVPAADPGLLTGPPPGDHCASESPDLPTVYSTAQAWLDPQLGFAPGAMPSAAGPGLGSVSCDSGDPANIWRAMVQSKDGPAWQPLTLVKVNISDWSCSF